LGGWWKPRPGALLGSLQGSSLGAFPFSPEGLAEVLFSMGVVALSGEGRTVGAGITQEPSHSETGPGRGRRIYRIQSISSEGREEMQLRSHALRPARPVHLLTGGRTRTSHPWKKKL